MYGLTIQYDKRTSRVEFWQTKAKDLEIYYLHVKNEEILQSTVL